MIRSVLVPPRLKLFTGVGISGRRSTHLNHPGWGGRSAWLDSLSVRCLSSYLIFAYILVTSTRAASQTRAGLPFARRPYFLSMNRNIRRSW